MARFIDLIWLTKVEKKAFICIFLISVLFCFSLIQANVLYIDDIRRVLEDDPGWENDGRPLASLASITIELGKPLTDISPLPQILCLALYSLSSVYLGKVFGVNNLVFLSLSGIAFVLNPFNLESFSYVFDSFTIGLAVFSSTAAFFIISIGIEQNLSRLQKIFVFFLSLLFLLSALCLYQPATSIYIAAFTFYSLLKLIRDANIKESVSQFLIYLTILLFSLIAYTPIKNVYVKEGYALRSSKISPVLTLPQTFIRNLFHSLKNIRESLGHGTLSLLISILFIIVVSSLLLLIFKRFSGNNNLNFTRLVFILIFSLFYFFCLIISFYGLSLVLINPPFWAVRTFMGFSAVVGIFCFYLSYIFYNYWFLRYFLIFFLCLLCLSFANVSLTFGNALYAQSTYEEIIATVLLSDLEEGISKLSNIPENPKIAVSGKLEPSPLTSISFSKYPILKKITTSYFTPTPNWFHSLTRLRSLGFRFSNVDPIPGEGQDLPFSSKPIISRRIYDIYLENRDTFVILFKNNNY
jgi:hypothetical protein